MADNNALIAHVLRRLTFGTHPARIAQFDGWAPTDVIEQLLSEAPLQPEPPELGSDDDYGKMPAWWFGVMSSAEAGVHERLVWMWHGLITSGLDKAYPALMFRQHGVVREHAMGNFRSLLQAVTVDAAMLYWLDGSGSTIEAPNENYSREVMELFAFGRGSGAYTESDVRAGAKAFAGYWVDGDNNDEVRFDGDSALQEPVEFLGATVRTAEEAIDAVCDHPQCARYIAGKVYRHLVGEDAPDGRLAELANTFATGGLEIRPLVEAIVRDPSFLEARHNRPRSGLEWLIALRHLYQMEIDWYPLDGLGQVPFNPPNVAGWPGDNRWLSAGADLTKAQVATDYAWDTATLDEDDPLGDLLRRAGQFEVSEATMAVLEDAIDAVESRRDLSTLLHALLACSPEFSLA
ncbi:MAG: DUF1800 family protein [Ilumatobacteraceae bacterium]